MYKRSIIRFNRFSNDIISVILLNYISKVNRIVYRAYTDIVNSGDSLKLIAFLPTTIPQTRHLISCGIQWMFDQIIASLKYSLYDVPNFLWFLRWCFRAVIRSPKLNKMNKTRRFSFIASRDNTQTTSIVMSVAPVLSSVRHMQVSALLSRIVQGVLCFYLSSFLQLIF